MWVGVRLGSALGAVVASGCGLLVGAAPVGSFSAVPIRMGAAGSRPFIQVSWSTVTPLAAAIPDSVSPGWTV